jgi:hypothetical protein
MIQDVFASSAEACVASIIPQQSTVTHGMSKQQAYCLNPPNSGSFC